MKSWYITDSLATESLTKHTIFQHLEKQEMIKLIRVSEPLDFLFQSIFYLLNNKSGKKERYILQWFRSILKGHIIDVSCLQKHWTQPWHLNHEKKKTLRKIKGNSSQSLHFRIFMFQITFTILVNKYKIQRWFLQRNCLTLWNQMSRNRATSNPPVGTLFPDKIQFFTQIWQYFVPQGSISISCLRVGSNSLNCAWQVSCQNKEMSKLI